MLYVVPADCIVVSCCDELSQTAVGLYASNVTELSELDCMVFCLDVLYLQRWLPIQLRAGRVLLQHHTRQCIFFACYIAGCSFYELFVACAGAS